MNNFQVKGKGHIRKEILQVTKQFSLRNFSSHWVES